MLTMKHHCSSTPSGSTPLHDGSSGSTPLHDGSSGSTPLHEMRMQVQPSGSTPLHDGSSGHEAQAVHDGSSWHEALCFSFFQGTSIRERRTLQAGGHRYMTAVCQPPGGMSTATQHTHSHTQYIINTHTPHTTHTTTTQHGT